MPIRKPNKLHATAYCVQANTAPWGFGGVSRAIRKVMHCCHGMTSRVSPLCYCKTYLVKSRTEWLISVHVHILRFNFRAQHRPSHPLLHSFARFAQGERGLAKYDAFSNTRHISRPKMRYRMSKLND